MTTLRSDPAGLSSAEAAERLRRYGPNVIKHGEEISQFRRLVRHLAHLMAWLLWGAGVLALIAGLPELAVAIWLVNVINAVFGYWQERAAGRAVAALQAMLPPQATVLRDGRLVRIPATCLVPGDRVELKAGDRISADGEVIESADLAVSQAALTGESAPVPKYPRASGLGPEGPSEGWNAPHLVFAGTEVVRGCGTIVVLRTGMATELGQIARLTREAPEQPSPLQLELDRVSRRIALLAVAIGMACFAGAVLVVGTPLSVGFVFALGMIVAFIPEGLVPTTTLSLAISVRRMARRNAIVKRLSAIETLGCTTVICTDKTGTLTANQMIVTDLLAGGQAYRVSGEPLAPRPGEIVPEPQTWGAAGDLSDLLSAAALCSDARLTQPSRPGEAWRADGDPTEVALLVAAVKGGIDLPRLFEGAPRLQSWPFDPERKRMSTLHRREAELVVYVKGAPDAVLSRASHVRLAGENVELDDTRRQELERVVEAMAAEGLRVLAIAERQLPEGKEALFASGQGRPLAADGIERDLTVLGLVAMTDPPREGVTEALARCRGAGIRILMLTGDHPLTAAGIARRIGLAGVSRVAVLSATEMDALDDRELSEALSQVCVIARCTPAQKLRIVSVLQGAGHVVAATGDGVNDAPALKRADIGIAMGGSGTDVAREAADMVLADDHFATIVNAIEEGRAVYDNIRRFVTYVFNSNVAEAAPFVLTLLSRGTVPLPLTVMQVLAIDLGTDMVPAIGLGAEPADPGVMERPPRSRHERLLSPEVLALAFGWYGLFEAAAGLAAYFFVNWRHGWPALPLAPPGTEIYRQATTAVLGAIVAGQVGAVLGCRTRTASLFKVGVGSNRLILWGIATELALLGALSYLPALQRVFGTAPLEWPDWAFVLVWGPLLLVADELRKAVLRRRARAVTR